MPILPPNQQRQSTEGINNTISRYAARLHVELGFEKKPGFIGFVKHLKKPKNPV